MKLSFKGKSAVITGASGGMGIECVKKLNKAGLNILMLDIKNPPANLLKKNKKIEFKKVDVTDLNGCIIFDTITITQPDSLYTSLTLSEYNGNQISCNGFTDGSIDILVNGGTATYTYYFNDTLITNPASDTSTIVSGLAAGTYTDSIVDANGCVFTETITLTEPAPLNSVLSTINTSCNGVCDGTISVNISGGTPGYGLDWGGLIQITYVLVIM